MMDVRLQQAIVAARAGDLESAQLLLAEAIRHNPEEANAWFLLSLLVDSADRRARYLEKTLNLQPEHALAGEQLARLFVEEVPPPIINDENNHLSVASRSTPAASVESEFEPLPPARIHPTPPPTDATLPSQQSARTHQQGRTQQTSKSVDADWRNAAGSPKREPLTAEIQAQPQEMTVTPVATSQEQQPVNKWLLVILIILVAVAAFVVGYLAYTIFLQ